MRPPPTHYRVHALLTVAAVYLFSVSRGVEVASLASEWLGPAALILIALTLAGTRLHLRSLKAALAVPDLFVFGAVSLLPLGAALPAAALVAAVCSMGEGSPRLRFSLPVVRGGIAVAGVLLARLTSQELESLVTLSWVPLAGSAFSFLVVTALAESLGNRLPYWRRLLASRVRGALAAALLFAPAALCVAVAFDAAPVLTSSLWKAAPALLLFYLLLEIRLGPLYEDPWKKDEMDQVYLQAVEALALAVEAKDQVSSTHLKRVQHYCVEIGKALNCSEHEIRALEFGALLHDIGKIAIPEDLLTKPSRLSAQEFKQMASHAEIGAEIVAAADFPFPVAELVRSHHENWDGTGYPRGLSGEQIPFTARILTVVDTFDALTSQRPYRAAMSVAEAVKFIKSRRGKAFDPRVVDALVELLPRLERELYRDPAYRRSQSSAVPAIRSARSIEVEQTALTYQERLESLKQERGTASEPQPAFEFSAFERLLGSLSTSLPPRELLEFLTPLLAERIPFDECAAFLSAGSGLMPVYATFWNDDRACSLRIPIDESPTGWVAANGRTLLNGNPAGEAADLRKVAALERFQSALVTPLWDGGKVVGTLNLYSQPPASYSEQHSILIEGLARGLGRALRSAERLAALAEESQDPLTGLPNARATLQHLEHLVNEACEGRREAVAVLCVDVDGFRALNARAGYSAGDRFLLQLVQTLQASQSSFEYLGRLGDDRFLAVVRESRRPQLRDLVRQLKQVVSQRCASANGARERLTISVGRVTFPTEASCARELMVISHQRACQDKLNRLDLRPSARDDTLRPAPAPRSA